MKTQRTALPATSAERRVPSVQSETWENVVPYANLRHYLQQGTPMQNPTRHLIALTTFLALATVPAVAQSPAPPPPPAAPAAPGSVKLVATWEGNYTTDGPSGTMTLVVVKDGAAWKVTVTLSGDAPPPAEPREIVADGDKLTWKQMFGDYDVTFKGTLNADGGQLTGTLEASQGGSYAGGGTFTLAKK